MKTKAIFLFWIHYDYACHESLYNKMTSWIKIYTAESQSGYLNVTVQGKKMSSLVEIRDGFQSKDYSLLCMLE